MNKQLRLKDKAFELYIPEREIVAAIDRMAGEIRRDMEGRDPLYVGILNGAFMFVSELVSRLSPQSELTFAAYSSYHGTKSDGIVRELLPIRNKDTERPIVLLEDIIDTGLTMQYVTQRLRQEASATYAWPPCCLNPDRCSATSARITWAWRSTTTSSSASGSITTGADAWHVTSIKS